ncbi:MAG: hypothetical protein KBT27_15335 [Prevotellaceae bacterium]|nr:hypothetical protein [Candidatus Faecinaster equi]
MATPYETIYDLASRKIEDFSLTYLPEEDLEDMFHGWLMTAISQFRQCKNDLSDRNDEDKQFNTDLLDIEKEILAILIVRAWLQPQLHSVLLTKQVFSDKEHKFYAQSQQMSELKDLDYNLKIEAQKLSRDYTYIAKSYFKA